MEYQPRVVQAIPGNGFTVFAYFSDGSVRLYDASRLIERGGVFAPLADLTLFQGSLTVMNHTVAWDVTGNRNPRQCIDIDPCTVYEGQVVEDPLAAAAAA